MQIDNSPRKPERISFHGKRGRVSWTEEPFNINSQRVFQFAQANRRPWIGKNATNCYSFGRSFLPRSILTARPYFSLLSGRLLSFTRYCPNEIRVNCWSIASEQSVKGEKWNKKKKKRKRKKRERQKKRRKTMPGDGIKSNMYLRI